MQSDRSRSYSTGISTSYPKQPPPRVVVSAVDFIDDGPSENCVNYEHFDRSVLFSPVPSNSSDEAIQEVIDSPRPQVGPVVNPLNHMDDFLKSCREESARIRSERMETPKISSITNWSGAPKSGLSLAKRAADFEDNSDYESPKKKCISNEEADKIKQRIIKESNQQFNSVGNSTKQNHTSKESSKSNGKGSWIESSMPSKDSIVHEDTETSDSVNNPDKSAAHKSSNGKGSWIESSMPSKDSIVHETKTSDSVDNADKVAIAAHKSSKLMEDIKRKLQKSQMQNTPKINVVGNTREITLPVNFKVEEYVDQILSPSCKGQGLKVYGGKYFVYFYHDLNH